MKRMLGLICLVPQLLQAQYLPGKDYPKGYFRNPLNVPIELAGNFGELRPNHFHSGIDIKTQQRENLEVHAVADGYVSRVGVSHAGFGNALYITHPNGYTTVYAHLNRFYPQLERYVKQKQYEQESWATSLEIPEGMFPVKKGDFVAWSGNTGGSGGPHLHLEIRNTATEKPLNPLLFGFDVPDKRAPEVYRVALYDRNKSLYEQQPVMLPVKLVNGQYVTTQPVVKIRASEVGVAVQAIDRMSNSANANGIYEVVLLDNDVPSIGFQLDNIGYDETRYLNAHIDYKIKKGGGPYLQLVFALPGNKLDVYHDLKGDGILDLSDGTVHQIKLLVKDAYGNTSTVKFGLQQQAGETSEKVCANTMYPDSRNIFENNQVEFFLEEQALYDRICFNYLEIPSKNPQALSNTFRLHTALVPVHNTYSPRIKTNRLVPIGLEHKVVMVREGAGGSGVSATVLEDGWYKGSFRDFGDFHLELDTIAPNINLISSGKGGKIAFSMSDASGIKSYRAELDGKWLMFVRRGNVLTYTFDEHCPPGSHNLKLTVTDEVGNTAVQHLKFVR